MDVYVYGCVGCGVVGALIRRVKRYATSQGLDFTLHESKHSRIDELQHLQYLSTIGINDRYASIVVYDNHVELLREWDR